MAENMRDRVLKMNDAIVKNQGYGPTSRSKAWGLVRQAIHGGLQDSMKGFTVNGEIMTVLRELGEGGSATVYEVFNSKKALCALKVVNLGDARGMNSASLQHDLIREIIFLEKLRGCTKVINVHEYELRENSQEHSLYLLMELGDRDFAGIFKELRDQANLTPAKVRYFWEQMLEAVQQIHELNIVHGDIKPANFLQIRGELKVIDFGFAVEVMPGQEYARKENLAGTRVYMSPEVWSSMVMEEGVINLEETAKSGGVLVSLKVDVWALGVILHQMVLDNVPFAEVPGGRLAKIAAIKDPDRPVYIPPLDDTDLTDTLRMCLEKVPEKRATVEQLLKHPYLRGRSREPSSCESCSKKNLQTRPGVLWDGIAHKIKGGDPQKFLQWRKMQNLEIINGSLNSSQGDLHILEDDQELLIVQ